MFGLYVIKEIKQFQTLHKINITHTHIVPAVKYINVYLHIIQYIYQHKEAYGRLITPQKHITETQNIRNGNFRFDGGLQEYSVQLINKTDDRSFQNSLTQYSVHLPCFQQGILKWPVSEYWRSNTRISVDDS